LLDDGGYYGVFKNTFDNRIIILLGEDYEQLCLTFTEEEAEELINEIREQIDVKRNQD
jgi:hypothetical protein